MAQIKFTCFLWVDIMFILVVHTSFIIIVIYFLHASLDSTQLHHVTAARIGKERANVKARIPLRSNLPLRSGYDSVSIEKKERRK